MIAAMNSQSVDSDEPAGRLLIVDDTRATRRLLVQLFRTRGIDSEATSDGRDAWDAIGEYIPDIVITDFEMPVWDGARLVKEIRDSKDQQIAELPVIIVSARRKRDLPDELLSHPLNNYLHKPIAVDELTDLLDQVHPGPADGRPPDPDN